MNAKKTQNDHKLLKNAQKEHDYQKWLQIDEKRGHKTIRKSGNMSSMTTNSWHKVTKMRRKIIKLHMITRTFYIDWNVVNVKWPQRGDQETKMTKKRFRITNMAEKMQDDNKVIKISHQITQKRHYWSLRGKKWAEIDTKWSQRDNNDPN